MNGSNTKQTQSIQFAFTFFYKYSIPNFLYQFFNHYPLLIQFNKKEMNDNTKTFIALN